MGKTSIGVEVVFALPERQRLVKLELDLGTTAIAAVERSGILEEFGACVPEQVELAIWGKRIEADALLEQGDRVEVLRPLAIDPRDARRRLAEEGGFMGGSKFQAGR